MKPLPFQRGITTIGNSKGFTVPADQISQGRILDNWEYEIHLIPIRQVQKATPSSRKKWDLWKEQQEPLPNLNKGNSRPSSLWDYRTMVKCAPLPIIDVMRFNDGTDEEVVFIEFA